MENNSWMNYMTGNYIFDNYYYYLYPKDTLNIASIFDYENITINQTGNYRINVTALNIFGNVIVSSFVKEFLVGMCSDGTLHYKCLELEQPRYCTPEGIIDACQICRCSKGYTCHSSGRCIQIGSPITPAE